MRNLDVTTGTNGMLTLTMQTDRPIRERKNIMGRIRAYGAKTDEVELVRAHHKIETRIGAIPCLLLVENSSGERGRMESIQEVRTGVSETCGRSSDIDKERIRVQNELIA